MSYYFGLIVVCSWINLRYAFPGEFKKLLPMSHAYSLYINFFNDNKRYNKALLLEVFYL